MNRVRVSLGVVSGVCAVGLSLVGAPGAGAVAAAAGEPGVGDRDRLTVTVDDGAGHAAMYELECHPAGGTHPDPQAACERLDALGGPVGPAPRGQMCTMIYGGPETATVVGSWAGEEVDARYSRTNGCETARWRDMAPVLPVPAAADGWQGDGPGRDARHILVGQP
ncbi:SSI family serine proteinase inhibitor [Streptomyces sp. NBC_01262]|uniref:SSI family serine proteinase inhibitor n=1 Tax=Streptomyces sp. NBC_01262 TaxID=2903803 RepID=UPI002E31CB8C|nr:SSI family serine proteinase inhibitor [Streptomyces sp. NBC_01262]